MVGPRAEAAAVGGSALIVSEGNGLANSREAITGGDAQSGFSLKLPGGAACSGDSIHDDYRVQSFMVNAGTDVAALTFGEVGPEPASLGSEFRQALFLRNTNAYVNAATNVAAEAGGAGAIIDIPVFTLSGFSASDLPPARYVLGIACTKGAASAAQIDRYWSATLDLSGADAAGSAHRRWTTPAIDLDSSKPASGQDASASATASTALRSAEAVSAGTGVAAEGVNATAQPRPAGGDPSFDIPALEIPSLVKVPGGSVLGALRWIVLVLVLARVGLLLVRTTKPLLTAVST